MIDLATSESGLPYLTMELHPGTSLHTRLAASGPLTAEEAISVTADLARALAYIHARGVVHRDVHAHNVMLGGPGTQLLDFGLSVRATGARLPPAGTLSTMAPEVLRGEGRVLSDVFGLGATLVTMLTGSSLYGDADAATIVGLLGDQRGFEKVRDQRLAELGANGLAGVLSRCLAFDPADRLETPRALLAALAPVAGGPLPMETERTRTAWVLGAGFVGRVPQLEALSQWRRDDPGRLAVVTGPAGVGKTRLVEEVRRQCQLDGCRFLEARLSPTVAADFDGWRELLRQALPLAAADLVARHGPQLVKLLPEHPRLADETPASRLEPRAELGSLVASVAAFFTGLGSELSAPLVLLLDDLQWCSAASRQTVAHILFLQAGPDGGEALRLLATVRDGEADAVEELLTALSARDRLLRVPVAAFDADEIRAYGRAVFGDRATSDALDRALVVLAGHVGGIVLHLHHEVGRLLEAGRINHDGTCWVLPGGLGPDDLPEDLRHALRGRILRLDLSAPERRALELLALLGREAAVATLQQLWAGVDVVGLVQELEGVEILQTTVVAGSAAVNFAHDALRQCVIDDIDDPAPLHGAIARTLQALGTQGAGALLDELAFHTLRSGDEQAAIDAIEAAAAAAAEAHANDRALNWNTQLLSFEAVTGARRFAACLLRAELHQERAAWPEARAALEDAASLADTLGPLEQAEVHMRRGALLAAESQLEEALDELTVAINSFRAAGHGRSLLRALGLAGTTLLMCARYDHAEACFLEQRQLAARDGASASVRAEIAGNIGEVHLYQGAYDGAQEEYATQYALALEAGDLRQSALAMGRMGTLHRRMGRYDEALACHRIKLEAEERMGAIQQISIAWGNVGVAHFYRGAFAQAKECFDRQLAIAEDVGDARGICNALGSLAGTLHRLGDPAGAVRSYDGALAIARERRLVFYEAHYGLGKAEVEADRSAWPACRQAAERAGAIAAETGPPGVAFATAILTHRAAYHTAHTKAERQGAVDALLTLAEGADGDDAVAAVHAALLDVDAGREHGEKALEAARRVHEAVPSAVHRARIDQLVRSLGLARTEATETTSKTSLQRSDFEELVAMMHDIGSQLAPDSVLTRVVDRAVQFVRADRGFLLLYEDGRLQTRVARTANGDDIDADVASLSSTVIEDVLRRRGGRYVANVLADSDLAHAVSLLSMDLRSVMCLPLQAPDLDEAHPIGKPALWGLLYVDSHSGTDEGRFKGDNLRYVQALADQAALAVANARRHEALHKRLDVRSNELAQHIEDLQREVEVRQRAEAELLREIAARQRLEAELRDAKEAAEAATEVKGRFLASMGHEIRTPLHGVLGIADLMLAGDLPAAHVDNVRTIRRSGATLLALLNDILDFSQLEAGRMPLREEVFDLWELSGEVVRLLSAGTDRTLDPELVVSPDVPQWVRSDPGRLRQVLLNLVSNALKFTDAGSVELAIHAVGSALRFEVRDTGIGIDPADVATIFEAFQQAGNASGRRRRGVGLGLAICRELVTLLGGTLTLESALGEGSTFRFDLDLPEAPAPRPAAALRVLLVDDDPINLRVAARTLEQLGHRVQAVSNAADAIDSLSEEPHDLVLMDCEMPQIDGFEATRLIRALPGPERNVPIIALTAYTDGANLQRCVDVGMNAHVSKPFDRAELTRTMERVTSHSRRG